MSCIASLRVQPLLCCAQSPFACFHSTRYIACSLKGGGKTLPIAYSSICPKLHAALNQPINPATSIAATIVCPTVVTSVCTIAISLLVARSVLLPTYTLNVARLKRGCKGNLARI